MVVPEVFEDERGFFMEVFRTDQSKHWVSLMSLVQDNRSKTGRNVVRGLHFQWEPPMGKLMRVTLGKAFLVAVDIAKARRHWDSGSGSKPQRRISGRSGRRQDLRAAFACFPIGPRSSTNAQDSTITGPNPGSCGTIRQSALSGPYVTRFCPPRTARLRPWSSG